MSVTKLDLYCRPIHVGMAGYALALVLALPAVASAEAEVDVEATPINAVGLPDGGWQAVAAVTLTVQDGGDNGGNADLYRWGVVDESADWEHVDGVAIALDVDGNAAWNPDVDVFHPDFPVAERGVVNMQDDISVQVYDAEFFLPQRVQWYGPVPTNVTLALAPGVYRWIVLYRLSPTTPIDAVFTPTFADSQYGWDGPIFGPNWGWFTQGLTVVLNPLFAFTGVAIDAFPLVDTVVVPGESEVLLGDYRVSRLSAGNYAVTSFTFGSVGDPTDILGLKIVLDTDSSGAPDDGDEAIGDIGGFAPGTAVPIAPLPVPEVGALRVFVVGRFDSELKDGMAYGVSVTAFSLTTDEGPQDGNGVPVSSGTVVATPEQDPHVVVAFTGLTSVEGSTVAGATLTIDAVDTPAVVRGLQLGLTGDSGVVAGVEVRHDLNANGLVEPVDAVIATASVTGDVLVVDLPDMMVPAGGRITLVLVPQAAAGIQTVATFGFSIGGLALDSDVPVIGLGAVSSGISAGGTAESDDPEFDPPPTGPFNVATDATTGCAAGAGGVAPWSGMLLMLVGLVATRCRQAGRSGKGARRIALAGAGQAG